MRGGVEVMNSNDYKVWLSEQETFSDYIAKNNSAEEINKIAKNNNSNLEKGMYIKE